MELFLSPRVEFEKNAAEVTLPEDPNQWPHEILQELYKQVPYISDFEPKIVMDRVDGERAFGFGHVDIQNKTEAPSAATPEELTAAGIRSARVPIVIKGGKLQPLDLIVTADSKILPLTENRLRQAIFRPQLFDITSKTPGDLSMIGQLYPPHRSNFGYGGAGVAFGAEGLGKTGSFKPTEAHFRGLGLSPADAKNMAEHWGTASANMTDADRESFYKAFKTIIPDVYGTSKQQGFSTLHVDFPHGKKGEGKQKTAADLTAASRDRIKPANFAIPAKKSDTGEGKYPIHDLPHARNALARVDQHGNPSEKAKVYAAIVSKYPELVRRSSVPEVQEKAEKKSSVLSYILPTINEEDYAKFAARFTDDNLRALYRLNSAATSPAIQKLASYEGWSAKSVVNGIVGSLRPSVMQITKVAEGYRVRSASHNLWLPKEEVMDRGKLAKIAGVKVALDADLNTTVTLASGANVDRDLPDTEHPEQIKDFGIWKVRTPDGNDLIGYVFPSLIDLDGQSVPVSLFTNGSHAALQADMAGVRVGEGASLFEGKPSGRGIFYKVLGTGRAAGTVPLTVHAGLEAGGSVGFMAETFDGQSAKIVPQPGIQLPTMADAETSVMPADWSWLPLDKAESVVLIAHAQEFNKQAEARSFACDVTIRSGGPNSFALTGMALDKLGSANTQFLNFDDAVFLLGGLGVAPAYAQQKLAEALAWPEPISCRVSRMIETAESNVAHAAEKTAEALASYVNLRRDLVKEAAFIPDPTAVDTVLSLGFINPENISAFISSLPAIDSAQEKMCEILLGARLGLQGVATYALERAIRATEEVIEGLRTIAFSNS